MPKRTSANFAESPGQRLAKLTTSALIVGGFIVYSLLHARSNAPATNPTGSTGDTGAGASATSTSTATGDGTAVPGAQYKEGAYTGGVTDAQWGYVQIQATISNGKIASVKFLQYPNDRGRSIEINQYADPQLVDEAIQAQSANVDIISGATDTSYAFIQSLGDALQQAQA
jgi:uncharacterized protein with FMN-binding domain